MRIVFASGLCLALCGRAVGAETPAPRPPRPLVLWHTQAQSNAALLQEIISQYNATNPPVPVTAFYSGDYTELFRKVRAAIPTGKVPDLVVAYESMIAEYIESEVVVPLDPYIRDAEVGLSDESLDDFFPSILENNRYPEYGGKFYTFPFTKSVLMLYYNADLLKAAGYDAPPNTWTEFRDQGAAIKAKLNKRAYALSVDASTFDGMVMSFGGRLVSDDRRRVLFDQPPAVAALRLLYDLARSGTAYQVDRESYGDRKDFAGGLCAFFIRSSTTRPYIDADIKDRFRWDMTPLPHSEGQPPVTVLFGANIAVMRTTPERQRAAWLFIKHFNSRDVTATWATGTGYLPVRKSAAETDVVKKFFAQNPRNRRAFDALPFARPEPGIRGWQGVRTQIELAQSRAMGGRIPPEELARELTVNANAKLGLAESGQEGTTLAVLLIVLAGVLALLTVGRVLKPRRTGARR